MLEPSSDHVRKLTRAYLDCEEIMTALDECHARGFIYKALGNCNDIKREVNRCLGAERADRAKQNREVARGKRQKIEDIWAKERALDASAVQTPAAATSSASTDGAKQ
ncbi:hypothetical protein N7466_008560 [Penicillium verhagenii]|uniref:uncharacterized protein n=1 Tax=Penicillium verhagenii TaxID=1562060 RepID=UPI0025454161|nr:uncharacterized protein N7466_008560 [Penicillium verhagenii]KAJ5924373.1 hypothetical protein N7466_008560 [Penicillium verhagenii]